MGEGAVAERIIVALNPGDLREPMPQSSAHSNALQITRRTERKSKPETFEPSSSFAANRAYVTHFYEFILKIQHSLFVLSQLIVLLHKLLLEFR